ncbi:MAG: CRISPR-associated helicase Cas3' [Candidatus Freyarchaeota archaeon]
MGFERFGFKPYRHQIECEELISDGCSFVLRAPTGSGKSEAVFIPFLEYRDSLPFHLIYSLPMRTLVEDIAERFSSDRFTQFFSDLRVVGHHGKRLDAPLFYADVVVTTIDQTVGAYACTPLSLPLRYGNIPAGAVSSAFLVFDEVHTFDPLLGLQTAFILAEHAYTTGLPFAFLSATLPDVFVEELKRRFNVEVVDAKEEDIPVRRGREVTLHYRDELLTPEAVLNIYDSSDGNLIVVCNTVGRAQELYNQIRNKRECEIILLHSRFLERDRQNKEKRLKKIFNPEGKSDKKGILISTQVIEVGLDISTDVMLSELAPIDSLIQRAGRCARRGGEGKFYVFNVKNYSPYDNVAELVDETKKKLKEINGGKITWNLEKELVNEILSAPFKKYLELQNAADILRQLAEGAFERNKQKIAGTVREPLSCEVSIHHSPHSLGSSVFNLQRIKIPTSVLKNFLKSKPKIWRVDSSDDDSPELEIKPVTYAGEIYPYEFYIIHPDYAMYSKDTGLTLNKEGASLGFVEGKEKTKHGFVSREESWVEHAENTLNVFREKFLPLYSNTLEKISKVWNKSKRELLSYFELVLVLHDLGKLNREWQRKIGAKDKSLAHSGHYGRTNLPPHATISAYALSDLWCKLPYPLGYIFQFVVAHHHSVAAKKVPSYNLEKEYLKDVYKVLSLVDYDLEFTISDKQETSTVLNSFPYLSKYKAYGTYCIFSRILRLSDRVATAGDEDTLMRFEEWLRS